MSEPTDATSLPAAVALHQSGQIDQAAEAYRRILESDPDHPDALHLLGVTLIQRGQSDQAVALIERAIARRPNIGIYHANLASAFQSLRRHDDAIAHADKAISLDPKVASRAYHIAGIAFGDSGQHDDAAFCFSKSLEADPNLVEARLMLSVALDRLGRYDESVAQQKQAIRLAEDAVLRSPNSGEVRMLLGRVYAIAGRSEEAADAYRAAAMFVPGEASLFHALGQVLQSQGKREEAYAQFSRALAINPRYADAHVAVGAMLVRQHRPGDAIESFRKALEIVPHHAEAQAHLSSALTQCGLSDEAIDACRRAVELNPGSASIHSTLLLTMHYSSKIAPSELFQAHVAWSSRHADRLADRLRPHRNAPDPAKKLTVGFVSGDFRKHPVAKYVLPVLEHHDRSRFAFTCYSDVESPDEVTERVRSAAAGWTSCVGWSETRLAEQIRRDEVDILIDLAGHTGTVDRLLTFARKPAPIQMTVFGYPDTTGLRTMDYRITDALSDPPGMTEAFHTEKLARLPKVAYCYRPYEATPDVEARSPMEPVAFGSVNNLAKLSDAALNTWAKVLEALPGARLVVLATSGDIDQTRRRLVHHGIDADRLSLLGRVPTAQYMDLFNQFDIALDPFPYNGGVTTCDALWMGVPVVALAGETYASRQGQSLLTNVGLPELVATTTDDYVRIATHLASDREQLAMLRQNLPGMMRAAPMCDYAGYTKQLEHLFRQAWSRYCGTSATA